MHAPNRPPAAAPPVAPPGAPRPRPAPPPVAVEPGGVRAEVALLRGEVRAVGDQVRSLAGEVRRQGRTDWPALLTAGGLAVTVAVGLGGAGPGPPRSVGRRRPRRRRRTPGRPPHARRGRAGARGRVAPGVRGPARRRRTPPRPAGRAGGMTSSFIPSLALSSRTAIGSDSASGAAGGGGASGAVGPVRGVRGVRGAAGRGDCPGRPLRRGRGVRTMTPPASNLPAPRERAVGAGPHGATRTAPLTARRHAFHDTRRPPAGPFPPTTAAPTRTPPRHADAAAMLTIADTRLPHTVLGYVAFRAAFHETLDRLAEHDAACGNPHDRFGFLCEVPFLRCVPPHVQLDLLAETWSRHAAHDPYEANVLDEAVLYAACETAGRLCAEEPDVVEEYLAGGPIDVTLGVDGVLAEELRQLHLNLAGEGGLPDDQPVRGLPAGGRAEIEGKAGRRPGPPGTAVRGAGAVADLRGLPRQSVGPDDRHGGAGRGAGAGREVSGLSCSFPPARPRDHALRPAAGRPARPARRRRRGRRRPVGGADAADAVIQFPADRRRPVGRGRDGGGTGTAGPDDGGGVPGGGEPRRHVFRGRGRTAGSGRSWG